MLNIVICDNDLQICEHIKELLVELIKEQYKCSIYTDPMQILKNNEKIDILFMDIVFPDANGIEIVKNIENNYNTKVIYISAYSQYVENIFETEPTYFILKPINKNTLKSAVDKCIKSINKAKTDKIVFEVRNKVLTINIDEIYYIESNKRILSIHKNNSEEKVYLKLSEIQKMLPSNFCRCHQSYIVNMEKIKELEKNEIILDNMKKVPISRSKYKAIKNEMLNYIREIV